MEAAVNHVRILIATSALLAVPLGTLRAGPNAGGVLNVHDASLMYTSDASNFCGLGAPVDSCRGIDVNLESSGAQEQRVWKVFAVFPEEAAARLKGIAFGVGYSPDSLVIMAHGACIGDPGNGAAEYPGTGWPAAGSGTSLVFQETRTTRLTECYWFAGYRYSAAPTFFSLQAHPDPVLGGNFADDSIPAVQDPIEGFGRLGFGAPGYLAGCGGEGDGQGQGVGYGEESGTGMEDEYPGSPEAVNTDGILILHRNDTLRYRAGVRSYCGMDDLDACDLALTSIPPESADTLLFFVLAAFPDSVATRVKTLRFGLEYDSLALQIVAQGDCADFRQTTPGWIRIRAAPAAAAASCSRPAPS
jgi:hypothetical protein